MNTQQQTEQVVDQHLTALIKGKGLDEILADYDDDAVFFTPDSVYTGKQEISAFFENFIANLPDNARFNFNLHCLEARNDMAYIVWSVNGAVPLGTDTFVVRNGKIVQQTFAMHAG